MTELGHQQQGEDTLLAQQAFKQGQKDADLLMKETKIHSENSLVTASTVKGGEGTFMGFVIYIRESSKQMRS